MAVPASTSEGLIQPLRSDPARAAILADVDGTLAPIVGDPADSAALPEAREALVALAERYAVVACVSGRRAVDARGIVGVDELTYLGNHGLERLEPGASAPRSAAALAGHEDDAARLVAGLDRDRLEEAGLRLEDKGPIRALHWRGAQDEERAERVAGEIGEEAREAGLSLHGGRKVLELRPPVRFDKGIAITELLGDHPVRHALYGGDDRTDLDGFRALRERAASGGLDTAVCVAVASEESPAELSDRADLIVRDPTGFAGLLRRLAA